MNPENKKPESLNEMQLRILQLEAEKEKLQSELKSREEMMSNLLSYLQNTTKV
jgi:hypothetical protein